MGTGLILLMQQDHSVIPLLWLTLAKTYSWLVIRAFGLLGQQENVA